jgi:hypothetical protein
MADHAICCAVASVQAQIGMIDATRRGYMMAHSSACIPPIEPPTTLSQRPMPSRSASSFCTRTMSRMVTTGKREP